MHFVSQPLRYVSNRVQAAHAVSALRALVCFIVTKGVCEQQSAPRIPNNAHLTVGHIREGSKEKCGISEKTQ